MDFAGDPTTTSFDATSLITVEESPMVTFSPISTFSRIEELGAIQLFFPTLTPPHKIELAITKAPDSM